MGSGESEHVKEEMVDIMIYLLRLADKLSIDLDQTVTDKLIKNAEKHPAKGWLLHFVTRHYIALIVDSIYARWAMPYYRIVSGSSLYNSSSKWTWQTDKHTLVI